MATTFRTILPILSPAHAAAITEEEYECACDYLPIAPSSRLWLPKLGEGNDERFANLFHATWHNLPPKTRRLIVKHWKNNGRMTIPWQWWSPLIALTRHWRFTDRCVRQPGDIGACGRGGHSLFFYAPVVDAMPAKHVQEVIAHELAHVVQHTSGDRPSSDRTLPRSFDKTEIAADTLMERWGFDSKAMDVWFHANRTWLDSLRASDAHNLGDSSA